MLNGFRSFYGFNSVELPIVRDGLRIYLDVKNPNSYSPPVYWNGSYLGGGLALNDLSGNGNNFSFPTGAPTYTAGSHPYLSTDKLGQGPASNSVGITLATGYTIQILANNRSLVNSSAFKFYQGNYSGSAGRGIFAHLPWSNDNVYFDQGGCCNADQRVNTATGGSNSWNLWTFRRNSSSRDIWKNGTRIATNTTPAAGFALDYRPINIFGDDDYGTAWNAWFSSFIVYNRGITDAEIIENSNAIKAIYGY